MKTLFSKIYDNLLGKTCCDFSPKRVLVSLRSVLERGAVFLLLVSIMTVISLPGYGSIPVQEREALIALYNSTDGDNWSYNSGWKTPPLEADGFALSGTENSWYGISATSDHVFRIRLNYNDLNGSIPLELGNLNNLESLLFFWNRLSGSIPPELANLGLLARLQLGDNQLSGSIPPELGNLGSLQNLSLGSNQLTGAIPPELGNLTNLRYLLLCGNQFTGTIPPGLANLGLLEILELGCNQLTGSIPPELGNLSQLSCLYLYNNQLSGSIPPELGNLSQLSCLYLYNNQLSGSIPPELANLGLLERLELGDNQLTGSIPPELGNLSSLTDIYLCDNQLTGSIPPELGNLNNLKSLRLYNNQLSGSIPPELGNMSSLTHLILSGNQLTGAIPPELGNMSRLWYLRLHNNQLTGSIPPELGNRTRLYGLSLSDNQLSGSIPPELGNLTTLYYLCLGGNQLSGAIPPELGNLIALKELKLDSNRLQGELPTGLAELPDLDVVAIDYNTLYSHDSTVITFLNNTNPGWAGTQTTAPKNVSAAAVDHSSIQLSWTPILYTADPGAYRVYRAANPGGPYTFYRSTADKSASSMVVSGLEGDKIYYFAVKTKTDPHANNANTVKSEYSEETSAKTEGPIIVTSPAGGESYNFGSEIGVIWTCSGITGDVKIILKGVDNAATYVIAPATPYNNSPFNYRIPCGVEPGTYYIKVKKPGVFAANSGYFTVSGTCISVNSPAGGETYTAGQQIPVNWKTSGITGDVKIKLARTDGTASYVIAPGVPYNGAPFNYTIPAEVTVGSYFIRVNKVGVISGKSNAFTIN